MTKRKLDQQRMQARHPHISYDLDGDGGVSARDYFIAKQFDKDNKGMLTKEERQEAQKAIQEGFTDKFVFGLERAGSAFLNNIAIAEGAKRPTDRIIADHIRVKQQKGSILFGNELMKNDTEVGSSNLVAPKTRIQLV